MNDSLCRLAEMPEKGVYVDLGIYGWSSLPDWRGRDPTLRLFEQFALEHGGYQVGSSAGIITTTALQGLYADTLLSVEDFKEMFAEFYSGTARYS